ncbi:uncharacterized protein N7479_010243 [Penicillium vulpinum]|uniref:Uncharacterized protein n=1 Tax=Penicillium vulpinum TaxID=29845 RepID=A0A1V6RFP2_9EURO|nr:uncharacterized protein N7479_010243 [Penicillium vulpinum]KAJ5951830.1 hypothetical protein N7479_010243 [Penicillium vulpinum]OQE00615.1 hypothetical protein PENVUL_c049G05071 [Penicillium vulpinum]
MAGSITDERCLAPELCQALDVLRTAVHSSNCCLTTARFLDSFPHLSTQRSESTQHSEIQRAIEKVARFLQDQKKNAGQAVQKAQATFEALSPEHQHGLLQYYEEDLRFYLEIAIPPEISHAPTTPFKLPSIQQLMRENRDEELRLLKLRSSAEIQLRKQFFMLNQEQQDMLWLWYQDFMGISGIQKDDNTQYSYSIRS